MKLKGIHTISRGMSLFEFKRDYMMLKGIHMILKWMSLYEFTGDPSIPTKPARKKNNIIPGDKKLYIIRHSGSWTAPFEIRLPGLGTKEFNK